MTIEKTKGWPLGMPVNRDTYNLGRRQHKIPPIELDPSSSDELILRLKKRGLDQLTGAHAADYLVSLRGVNRSRRLIIPSLWRVTLAPYNHGELVEDDDKHFVMRKSGIISAIGGYFLNSEVETGYLLPSSTSTSEDDLSKLLKPIPASTIDAAHALSPVVHRVRPEEIYF